MCYTNKNTKEVISLNLPQLEGILDNFHKITNLDIAIIDSEFRVLVRRHSGTEFCTYIHKNTKCLEKCIASDNIQMRFVNESKKLVKYICPFGIYEAIAPVMKNGDVVAYIFLSMGIEDKEGSSSVPFNNAVEVSNNFNEELLKKYIDKIPAYSIQKLDACAEMLPVIAEFIENNNLLYDAKQSIGQMIKDYVKNNIDKKITLADLSYSLHCSTVTLTKHFKEEFGITIMDYVTEKRMKMASKMLLEGSYSVHEIAEKCGFSDSEYFSRCFKSHYGLSPLAWKTQNRTNHSIRKMQIKNQ